MSRRQRRKKREDRKLKNTHFWRSYRLYLSSLRHIAYLETFDKKLRKYRIGVYLRFVSNISREIILKRKRLKPPEEYVLKLRYCTLVQKIFDEHPDIDLVIYRRTKRMLEQYSKSYLSDIETLKRKKLLDEFEKDYIKQNGKKAVPKKLKKERKKVELSDIVTSEEEETTESSSSSEEEEINEEEEERKKERLSYTGLKKNCPHTRHVGQLEIPKEIVTMKCQTCETDENWLCLTCGLVLCSRYKKGHMTEHILETRHPIAVSLEDLSFWCFRCNSYIHHDRLIPITVTLQHYKFGKPKNVPQEEEEEESTKTPPTAPPIPLKKKPPKFESLEITTNSPILHSPATTEISPEIFDVASKMSLRKVVLSETVIKEFLKLAERHIRLKVEFCGMLCGILVDNYDNSGESCYLITHCCVPDQAGHSDYVVCYDEHVIHQFQVRNGLIAIGWIHTHPTQDAFLSSMDIYTQFGFQRMMEEFIAVVCAPRRVPTLGVFRIKSSKMEKVRELTVSNKKFGKRLIKLGRERMYENCEHCEIVPEENASGLIVDLRKNKRVRVLK